jgi:hypothetical protein
VIRADAARGWQKPPAALPRLVIAENARLA